MTSVNGAVVRLKRRNDEEPLEALVLACKRRKSNTDACKEHNNPFTTILKFAGTVKNQEESVGVHIASFREDVKAITRAVDKGLNDKLREEIKKNTQENRFRVVNSFRALDDGETTERTEKAGSQLSEESNKDLKNVIIVDIEESTSKHNETEAADSFVYDLYYTSEEAGNLDDALLDQMVSVLPLQSDLVYEVPDSDEECADDDVDSNDENNFRNEYPDTDDSMDDQMKLAMEMGEFHIGEELSSDEADEGYLRFEDADPLEVARYGNGYAGYKLRINRELYNHTDQSSSSED